MKIALMEFQEEYIAVLLDRLTRAKRYVRDGEQECVLLAAPTGSGKTVMLTSVIESALFGTDSFPAEPDAVFLWLSDQPELNEQSRLRIRSSSDKLRDHQLVLVESDFDADVFLGGRVYFINTQKLGKSGLLTSRGDRRRNTIWQIIENTQHRLKDKFYLVVDEAHRGMNVTASARSEAQTIAQKFLLGSAADGLSPLPLVLGMTATPARFTNLVGNTDRHIFNVPVDVAKVRASGLLKDRLLVMVPADDQPSDWSLLAAAGQQWRTMREFWAGYCAEQNISVVEPILVVQVQDAQGEDITATDLSLAIETLQESMGELDDLHLAHCFQEAKEIIIDHHKVRHLDPSRVSADPAVRVVFFKTALTTGWDCPRAEVMMSFRHAQDPTAIAQLIGRMVRTPLARRIENNESLNDVFLYLPYFDKGAVEQVVSKLSSDTENVPAISVELGNDVVPVAVPSHLADAHALLSGKPTYQMITGRKLTDTRRLLRFGTLLSTIDAIDSRALPAVRDALVSFLQATKQRLKTDDEDFQNALADVATIRVRPLTVDYSDFTIVEEPERTITVSDANADDIYRRAKARLGDDIVVDYMRRELDSEDPIRTKIEIFLLAQREDVLRGLESLSKGLINDLRKQHDAAIRQLPSSRQARYQELWALARVPEPGNLMLPSSLLWQRDHESRELNKHLYVRQDGGFSAEFNEWEMALVRTLTARQDVKCWLRNLPRKSWSFAYWYEPVEGGYSLAYPDLVVVRSTASGTTVDLYEPHGEYLADSWHKAKGLAWFADAHSNDFGRVAFVRVQQNQLQMLDFANQSVRASALQLNNDGDLFNLFETSAEPV
jgi:type III restriction enzyme